MWFPRRRDPRIRDEIQFHRDHLIDDYMAAGMSRIDAERRAFMEFGNVPLIEEHVKDARGRWFEGLGMDIRYALRTLGRSRGFTAVAVLILALGIGANTAIFSVIHAILLRPLPYETPEQLVVLRDSKMPQFPSFAAAPGRFVEWQRRARSFASIGAATSSASDVTITVDGEPERLRGARVSKELFQTLGVTPLAGRAFTADEDRASGPDVALISYGLWQSRFGGNPAILGLAVHLDNRKTEIIGIMPAWFEFPSRETQIWRPLALPPEELVNYGRHNLLTVARLRADVTVERAQQDMIRISRELESLDEANVGWTVVVRNMHEYLVRDVRLPLLVLAWAAAFVLLIGCANLANLLLARGLARRRELALRAALGATRARLGQQLMIEHLLLGVCGGLAGVLLAWGLLRAFVAAAPRMLPGWTANDVDPTTLSFALLFSLLSPLMFGLLPTFRVSLAHLTHNLVLGGRNGSSSLGRGTRHALVVAEIALALLLVIAGGLLLRTSARLAAVDPGFEPEQTLVTAISLPELRYPEPASRARFFETLRQQAATLPGVQAVGLSSTLPFRGGWIAELIAEGVNDAASDTAVPTDFYAVSPGYFSAMKIPLIQGRDLVGTDSATSPPVAVVSQLLADRMFPGQNPIGRRIKVPVRDSSNNWHEIVGIVGNVKQFGLDRETTLQVYEPMAQHPTFVDMSLVLRSASPTGMLTSQVRGLLRRLDPALAIISTTTMASVVAQSVGTQRLMLFLLCAFAVVALVLAAVGIYGMLSFAVGQRTQEIGVRMAHGARPRDILVMVLGQGLAVSLIGIAIGLVGAAWLTRLTETLLFGVDPRDPLAFVAAPAILLIVAIVAMAVPALRAMRVDPIVALRPDA